MAVNETREPEVQPIQTAENKQMPQAGLRRIMLPLLAVAFVGLAIVIFYGIHSRVAAETTLKTATEAAAIPVVNVTYPTAGAATQEIVLPGNTQPFTDTPIYARTSGYLKAWYFDIGAHVKKGQLLAEIETPELDQQLQQSRADLETAQANMDIARTTATRLQGLVKSGSVSQQDTDVAVSDLSAKKAAADSSASNVRRLEQMQSFEKVYAPFDGIVTARNTDIGALIDAGSAGAPKELFHMAAIGKLRVYVAVPEVYSRAAQTGAGATLTLDEFPGRVFQGTLVRNSDAIDPTSRTLLVEVDVDNPTGQLLPGAYALVHLKLPEEIRSMTIPSNALLFRKEGLQVGVVRNDHAELIPVKIGRDYGSTVEILSGLQPTDPVILDPSDSLLGGTQVQVSKPRGGAAQ